MKKITFKSLLVTAMLCLSMGAWAEDVYTAIYSRVTTFGANNVWTESDITAWGGNENLKLSLPTSADDAGTYYGLGFETTKPSSAYSATKTFDIAENSKIKYNVTWYTGNSTGRTSNFEYIQFGENIRLSYTSDYYFYLDYAGSSTTTNQLFKNKSAKSYNITVIFKVHPRIALVASFNPSNSNLKYSSSLYP